MRPPHPLLAMNIYLCAYGLNMGACYKREPFGFIRQARCCPRSLGNVEVLLKIDCMSFKKCKLAVI